MSIDLAPTMHDAMSLVLFALPRFLTVAALYGAAYAVGRALFRRYPFKHLAEKVLLSTALGVGVISHLILSLGLFGWLTAAAVSVSIFAAAALAIFVQSKGSRLLAPLRPVPYAVHGWRKVPWTCIIVSALAFLPLCLLSLYPPTEFDVTAYHLAAPKHWLRIHTIDPTPFLRYQVGPNLAHFIFTALMATAGDIPPQVFSVGAVSLIAIGLYAWGMRLQGRSAGILAAALWIGSPATLEIATNASYHPLATLFAFISIYTMSQYGKERRLDLLFWAGLFLGFAESTWLGVLAFVPVFIGVGVYLSIRERRSIPMFFLFGGLFLGWGPTIIRSAWFTGNPTYPLLTQVFGTGPWWTANEFSKIEGYVRSTFGVSRNLANFFALPYLLVVSPQLFQAGHGYSPALSLLVPLVGAGAVLKRISRALLALVIFYITCWFFSGQIMRYLLPIVPVICLLSALTLCWVISYFPGAAKGTFGEVLIAVAAIIIVVPGAWALWKNIVNHGPIPVTEKQRTDYIAARIIEFNAIQVANANPAPIYAFGAANCAYYAEDAFMGDELGPGRYIQMVKPGARWVAADSVRTTLHRLGAKYLLLSANIPLQFPRGPGFDDYFDPIYGDSSAELYRILDSPRSISATRKNLLENADFEELSAGMPVSWNRRGTPVVGAPPGGPSSGRVAIEVSESDGFQQLVKVAPGETYELALRARAGARGKVFRLQVNWIDKSRQVCATCIRLFEAKDSWQGYVARFTVPPCAAQAEVYASAQPPSWVWLDSFEFIDTGAFNPARASASGIPNLR
jgi:hypothetical protein